MESPIIHLTNLCSDVLKLIFIEIHPIDLFSCLQVSKFLRDLILDKSLIYTSYVKWVLVDPSLPSYHGTIKTDLPDLVNDTRSYHDVSIDLLKQVPNLAFIDLIKDSLLINPRIDSTKLYSYELICLNAIRVGQPEDECLQYLQLENSYSCHYDSLRVSSAAFKAGYRRILERLGQAYNPMYDPQHPYIDVQMARLDNKSIPATVKDTDVVNEMLEDLEHMHNNMNDYTEDAIYIITQLGREYLEHFIRGLEATIFDEDTEHRLYIIGYTIGQEYTKEELTKILDGRVQAKLPESRKYHKFVTSLHVIISKDVDIELINSHRNLYIRYLMLYRADLYIKLPNSSLSKYKNTIEHMNPYYVHILRNRVRK